MVALSRKSQVLLPGGAKGEAEAEAALGANAGAEGAAVGWAGCAL